MRAGLARLSRRGALPRAVWARLPAPDEMAVALPNGSSFRYRAGWYDSVARELYWRGLDWDEGASLRPFFRLAAGARVVVDVGSNIGLYALVACAANERSRVIAFEPVPESASRIKENAARNGWSQRIDVREEAVSDTVGTVTFHVPFGPTPASASMNRSGFRSLPGDLVEVPVTTLDTALKDVRGVDLVKIDVEHFEHLVLAGMRATVERDEPALVIECNVDGPIDAVASILGEAHYRPFKLTPSGPVPIDDVRAAPSERYRNMLFLRRPDHLSTVAR